MFAFAFKLWTVAGCGKHTPVLDARELAGLALLASRYCTASLEAKAISQASQLA